MDTGMDVNMQEKDQIDYWSTSERGMKAEQRLHINPYDLESWGVLIREAQGMTIKVARPLYERLVARFPNAGRYWRLYIEQEMKNQNYGEVEKLFQRCLIKVLHIDLWKCYLNYVKETKSSLSTFREKMVQAYEFALEKIGLDVGSYQIWMDYLTFLKSGEASGSYAENQKIMSIRRVYQRAVVTPLSNLEGIWREYNTFEQGINKVLAKKLIDDRTRDYMNARRAAKEYEAISRGLVRGAPSVPAQGTPAEMKQLQIWKKCINWEKNNPLRTEDTALLTKRVMFQYEQCLLTMGFHCDIWYETALYLENTSKMLSDRGDMQASKLLSDEAASLYERAVTTQLHDNKLIHFAYADFEESRTKFDKCREIYEKLLAVEHMDPTLVYIQYMKFARRSAGIKDARQIFKRAREDQRTHYHVFVAAALMEYYSSKDKGVAFKIFELGLKKYVNEPEYVLAYVDYLTHLNEDNNTRVLFEKVLTTMPKEKSSEVWASFQDFESTCGDLVSLLKVEKRRLQVQEMGKEDSPESTATMLLVDRYKYLELHPCTSLELKALGYPTAGKHSTGSSSSASGKDKHEDEKPKNLFPRPDPSQMMPFKPVAGGGVQTVPGGVFALPPSAIHLMTLLPPPRCFQGPFVIMDELLKSLAQCKLPDPKEVFDSVNGVKENGKPEVDQNKGTKRPNSPSHDSDDESTAAPPVHDIYRSRQQKRVHVL